METLINHPRLRVSRRFGSEGSRHDPYVYYELHVETPVSKTVIHEGLVTWMTVDGLDRAKFCGRPAHVDETHRWLREDQFPRFTGHTIKQIERIVRRKQERRP